MQSSTWILWYRMIAPGLPPARSARVFDTTTRHLVCKLAVSGTSTHVFSKGKCKFKIQSAFAIGTGSAVDQLWLPQGCLQPAVQLCSNSSTKPHDTWFASHSVKHLNPILSTANPFDALKIHRNPLSDCAHCKACLTKRKYKCQLLTIYCYHNMLINCWLLKTIIDCCLLKYLIHSVTVLLGILSSTSKFLTCDQKVQAVISRRPAVPQQVTDYYIMDQA